MAPEHGTAICLNWKLQKKILNKDTLSFCNLGGKRYRVKNHNSPKSPKWHDFACPINDLWVTEVGNTKELTHECSAFSIKEKRSRGKCQSCPLAVIPTVGRAPCHPAGLHQAPGVSSPGMPLVLQHTQGLKELPIHSLGGNWSLCTCLDQMITLSVQPLKEQTWRNSGERNSHLSAG